MQGYQLTHHDSETLSLLLYGDGGDQESQRGWMLSWASASPLDKGPVFQVFFFSNP